MKLTANEKFYLIDIRLFWGSDTLRVTDEIVNNKNFIVLKNESIQKLEIVSSLATPFIYGSFIVQDSLLSSSVTNFIDMPIIYGNILFSETNGDTTPGGNNNCKPNGNEYFDETVMITGIDTINNNDGETINLKFNFASVDIMNFYCNIENVSTFNKKENDKVHDDTNNVIKNLFGAAKLSKKLDMASLDCNINMKIPFISSSNETLLSALDFVYRKVFDYNFDKTKQCSYCRMRYNHINKRYELWKYENVGSKRMFETDEKNSINADSKWVITLDTGESGMVKNNDGILTLHTGDNTINLFDISDNVTYTHFDYLNCEFSNYEYVFLNKIFNKHKNDINDKMVTKTDIISSNSSIYDNVHFMRAASRSRVNSSMYDLFSEQLFNNAFIRIDAKGIISRMSGDSVYLKFVNEAGTPYELIGGDYTIIAIKNVIEKQDKNTASFRSIMDVYRPYTASDTFKSKIIN